LNQNTTGTAANVTGTVAIANGGTGATTAAAARTSLGVVASNSAITGATKTKITYDSKGLVTSGADATTADIASSADKRYVTDAQLTVIGNTSGTNTGNETAAGIRTKLGITTLSGSNTGDQTITLTGDVTGSGTGSFATTIANSAISTIKIADAAVTDAKISAVAGSKVSGNISGNAANVTGTVAVANGGTGVTTATQNFVFAGPATGSAAGAPSFRALTTADLPASISASSVANSITFAASGGAAAGTTYNGSAAKTIDYSTVGASPSAGSSSITTVGTISSGTWNGSIIGSAYGGTGNGFTEFTGPTSSKKTFTLPNSNATLARTDAAQTFAGIQTYSGQIVSSIATGTAPFSVTSTTPVANLNIGGKAAQATVLETARTINGVSFDGSSNITVTSAAGTLTGTTLSSSVVSSSLTSVGTLANLTVTNAIAGSVTGNAATSTKLATARKINGVNFDGTADITIASIGLKITNYSLAPLKPSESPESASIAPTAADLLASGIIQFTELPRWTTRNLTFPSASSIVAALPNAKVGDTFTIVLNTKDDNNDINYKFDAGGLTNFCSTTLGNSSARSLILTFRVTNITSGSEAVSIY
jgi:hypothetical protein